MALHEDELRIDEWLVRRLVDTQLPQYAEAPVSRMSVSGSSNALFALGPDLVVRLPRQPGGSETILKEARWLPVVGPRLPVAVPHVVHVGRPGHGYPEHWSVLRRLPGERPRPPGDGHPGREWLARDLADLLTALREVEVPPDAEQDPSLRWYRAEPLTAMDPHFRRYLEGCRVLPGLDLDLKGALSLWEDAMAVEPADSAVRWLHGDLLAENLLVTGGRLSALLDFGGLAVGDPTVDLAVAWELLDTQSRHSFRSRVDVDDATWTLGRAWALALAVMTFPYYWRTMPHRCADRLMLARRVLADR